MNPLTSVKDEDAFDATMNVVIIYDRFDFAAKANAMLERAAHGTDEIMKWSVRPWRVDMLKLPPAAEAALVEAADAHLIVLAGRKVQALPPWLADWLERWAASRQVQEAALAVWDDENADTGPARETAELSQFARRHGLSLILDADALAGDESPMFGRGLDKGEVSAPSTLKQTLQQPVSDSYRHWGINE
jgi:hypothetical protein